MKLLVLDPSVAAKWFLPPAGEPLFKEATALYRHYARAGVSFVVPDLFWPEVGNVLWKAARAGRLSHSAAASALGDLRREALETVRSLELIETALAVALATMRTVYDSLYITLALRRGLEFVTADERLVNALGGELPVRWLGKFDASLN